jgi:hypothetical protein
MLQYQKCQYTHCVQCDCRLKQQPLPFKRPAQALPTPDQHSLGRARCLPTVDPPVMPTYQFWVATSAVAASSSLCPACSRSNVPPTDTLLNSSWCCCWCCCWECHSRHWSVQSCCCCCRCGGGRTCNCTAGAPSRLLLVAVSAALQLLCDRLQCKGRQQHLHILQHLQALCAGHSAWRARPPQKGGGSLSQQTPGSCQACNMCVRPAHRNTKA